MLPLCAHLGVGAIPYSPLGKGRLTRPWDESTARSSTDKVAAAFDRDVDEDVVNALAALSAERDVPMAQLALAWLVSKPVVSAPIVGATKPHHLDDAVAALEVELSPAEIERLEAPYRTQDAFWW